MKKLVGLVSIKGKTAEQVHQELLDVLEGNKKNYSRKNSKFNKESKKIIEETK